ncbi:MAG TPA: hypothetical protein VED67_05600 [Thermodesulfovibrionales bacterium]|nr:hypothetical protein [Thermodesulfovibrionales bacterium]
MISFKGLAAIFRGTGFTDEELRAFYDSVKKSVTLRLTGKRSWPEMFKLEDRCQWPVLRRLGDPGLPIYEGADPALLERFIKTISEEQDLRGHKASFDKVRYWSLLQSIIDERIGLFTQIFGYSDKDIERCERVAERYGKIREKRIRNRKKMWKIGIGTGVATVAGAAALWYVTKKDKK